MSAAMLDYPPADFGERSSPRCGKRHHASTATALGHAISLAIKAPGVHYGIYQCHICHWGPYGQPYHVTTETVRFDESIYAWRGRVHIPVALLTAGLPFAVLLSSDPQESG